jgi:hypothetical protein
MRRCLGGSWIALLALVACADGDTVDGGGGAGGVVNVSTGVSSSSSNASSASSTTNGSTSTTTSASSSGSTTSSSNATSSSTGPNPTCDDTGPGEPGNDTRATAHSFGSIGDDDDDGGSVAGVIASMNDVDWYTYTGSDDFGSIVDPARSLVGPGLEICKYLECIEGDADFACPSNTTPDTVDGLPGCCWTGAAEVAINAFTCEGTLVDDDARVFIRVRQAGAEDCEPYTLTYHF